MPNSSDPIVLSLKSATDHREFELLCSDILAGTVYPGIEPIGGTGDGGRDALYSNARGESVTVCAFSLRKDWEQKLELDCERVNDLQHKCNTFLFATSMQPTPAERDKAVDKVKSKYGWNLELYGRERLATAIRGNLGHLIERHPSIFKQSQFRLAGGRLLETSRREILLIDHEDRDQGFAHWVARCLQLMGYDVWCRGMDSVSGEVADKAIRELLESRVLHHLPVLSKSSVSTPDFRGRLEQSSASERRLLPLLIEPTDLTYLSQRIQEIEPVHFEKYRAKGIRTLYAKLDEWGVPKDHEVVRKRRNGLQLPAQTDYLRNESETLVSNVFPVTKIPNLILEWRLNGKMNGIQTQTAQRSWPFVKSGDYVYSFISPPDELKEKVTSRSWKGAMWQDVDADYYNGKSPRNVVAELIRRTMEFSLFRSGLLWCPEKELIYFNPKKHLNKRLPFKLPNGGSGNRAVCGKQKKWRPNDKSEDFKWQLAPSCRCYGGNEDPWEIRTRVQIRVTYPDGRPIESSRIITFRKKVTNGWTQDKFRDLNLLMMQHASKGDETIRVGEDSECVEISSIPFVFNSPVSIAEDALPKGANRFAKRSEKSEEGSEEDEV
jgi:hypothetical protein